MDKIRPRLWRLFGCKGRSRGWRSLAVGVCLGLMAFCINIHHVVAAENTALIPTRERSLPGPRATETRPALRVRPAVAPHPKWANFNGEHKSENVRDVADWVADSRDNRGMPFAIIDKVDARVFVFDAHGRLRGASPVLIGLTPGDDNVRGIGNRRLSAIRPGERTTAAGRFVASLGYNARRTEVLWVDYKNAVSLHRVITNNPGERRLERLTTPTPLDNRISYGCINVPADFFGRVVKPAFTRTYGIVYILPEAASIGETFTSWYNVGLRWGGRPRTNIDENPKPMLQQQDLRFGS